MICKNRVCVGMRRWGFKPLYDPTYSDEEAEFLKAMQRFKTDHRKPYPTWQEVLQVVKSLGYRKAAAG